jgi:hypothetical protein
MTLLTLVPQRSGCRTLYRSGDHAIEMIRTEACNVPTLQRSDKEDVFVVVLTQRHRQGRKGIGVVTPTQNGVCHVLAYGKSLNNSNPVDYRWEEAIESVYAFHLEQAHMGKSPNPVLVPTVGAHVQSPANSVRCSWRDVPGGVRSPAKRGGSSDSASQQATV